MLAVAVVAVQLLSVWCCAVLAMRCHVFPYCRVQCWSCQCVAPPKKGSRYPARINEAIRLAV
eukprot:10841489-Alexandrium_andersonii.AAC.1